MEILAPPTSSSASFPLPSSAYASTVRKERRRRHHRRNHPHEHHRHHKKGSDELIVLEDTSTSDSSSTFLKEPSSKNLPSDESESTNSVNENYAESITTATDSYVIAVSTVSKKKVRFESDEALIVVIDIDVHDDTEDRWYSDREYKRFRLREAKITKEMTRSFDGASFSVDGVESILYRREKRHRMSSARFGVLLKQESFWQREEPDGYGIEGLEQREFSIALSYSEASRESVRLALERADWNAKQVVA